jgi:hypothetical protein
MNCAQQLLCLFGGKAELVAGKNGHWWADQQTPKRIRTKNTKPGAYGRGLQWMFSKTVFLSKQENLS